MLTIIVVVGAMALPSLNEMLQRQRLRSTVSDLRLRLDEARMEAQRTGQAQVFACQLETGQYSIQPLVMQNDALNAGEGATVVTGGAIAETDQNGMLRAQTDSLTDAEELENDIVFHACMVVGDNRALATAQQAQATLGTANELSTANVAQRIIFYADGSTSNAEVQVRNARGDVRAIQIRGITGHSRILDVSNQAWEEDS